MRRVLFYNTNIFTPLKGSVPSSGKKQGEVAVYERGALLSENGLISAVGATDDVLKKADGLELDLEVDLGGACVIPGFVDPHTHICFAERREREFSMRLAGKPYLEILKAGGGILSSVDAVVEKVAPFGPFEGFDDFLDDVLTPALAEIRDTFD